MPLVDTKQIFCQGNSKMKDEGEREAQGSGISQHKIPNNNKVWR